MQDLCIIYSTEEVVKAYLKLQHAQLAKRFVLDEVVRRQWTVDRLYLHSEGTWCVEDGSDVIIR